MKFKPRSVPLGLSAHLDFEYSLLPLMFDGIMTGFILIRASQSASQDPGPALPACIELIGSAIAMEQRYLEGNDMPLRFFYFVDSPVGRSRGVSQFREAVLEQGVGYLKLKTWMPSHEVMDAVFNEALRSSQALEHRRL